MALSAITDRIYARFDRLALDLGRDLNEAYEIAGKRAYERWVDECLPFGVDKARRLRAIHLAYEHLPADKLAALPRPWQAMYAFTRLSPDQVTEAIEAGTIHPDMTVKEAVTVAQELSGRETKRFSEVDLLVGRIVNLSADELGEAARRALDEWLRSA